MEKFAVTSQSDPNIKLDEESTELQLIDESNSTGIVEIYLI